MFNFLKIIMLISTLNFHSYSYASLGERDWMNYLNESCSTTVRGKLKRVAGERAFWAHVNASMD